MLITYPESNLPALSGSHVQFCSPLVFVEQAPHTGLVPSHFLFRSRHCVQAAAVLRRFGRSSFAGPIRRLFESADNPLGTAIAFASIDRELAYVLLGLDNKYNAEAEPEERPFGEPSRRERPENPCGSSAVSDQELRGRRGKLAT